MEQNETIGHALTQLVTSSSIDIHVNWGGVLLLLLGCVAVFIYRVMR